MAHVLVVKALSLASSAWMHSGRLVPTKVHLPFPDTIQLAKFGLHSHDWDILVNYSLATYGVTRRPHPQQWLPLATVAECIHLLASEAKQRGAHAAALGHRVSL